MCGPPRGEGPEFTASGGALGDVRVLGPGFFPQISAPARPPRPACSPSGITPEKERESAVKTTDRPNHKLRLLAHATTLSSSPGAGGHDAPSRARPGGGGPAGGPRGVRRPAVLGRPPPEAPPARAQQGRRPDAKPLFPCVAAHHGEGLPRGFGRGGELWGGGTPPSAPPTPVSSPRKPPHPSPSGNGLAHGGAVGSRSGSACEACRREADAGARPRSDRFPGPRSGRGLRCSAATTTSTPR